MTARRREELAELGEAVTFALSRAQRIVLELRERPPQELDAPWLLPSGVGEGHEIATPYGAVRLHELARAWLAWKLRKGCR